MFKIALVAILTSAWLPGVAQAQTDGADPWYRIVTGIVAIPVALLGLLLAVNVLRKTTLESRKLELEIAQAQQANEAGTEDRDSMPLPLSHGSRALLLIVRFVILDLTLRLWNVVPAAVNSVAELTQAAVAFLSLGGESPTPALSLVALILPTAVGILLNIIYWIILFGFGWPLLKDTCRFLGIPVGSLLDLPYLGRWKRHGT